MPDYPFAVITHPVSPLDQEEILAHARQALPQVIELLLAR
nr:hypothetical protein [uncultured bacterium]